MKNKLINSIKSKKEFSYLDDNFIDSVLENYFLNNPIPSDNERSSLYKKTVKDVRKILREVFGVFQFKDNKKRNEILNKIKSVKDIELHEEILKTHISTRERLDIYDEIYSKIFEITGQPKIILDLACGINPVSFPFMKLKNVKLICYELSKLDCDFVNNYFKKLKINGEAFVKDLLKTETYPKADITFLFKTLDSLESLKRNYSSLLLKRLNSDWIVVSFATKSLGGKKDFSKRMWFERLLMGHKYFLLKFENEIFYVIKRN